MSQKCALPIHGFKYANSMAKKNFNTPPILGINQNPLRTSPNLKILNFKIMNFESLQNNQFNAMTGNREA